jgi:hypothetical protein
MVIVLSSHAVLNQSQLPSYNDRSAVLSSIAEVHEIKKYDHALCLTNIPIYDDVSN